MSEALDEVAEYNEALLEEVQGLAAELREQCDEITRLTSERDAARGIAATLEQQNAEALRLALAVVDDPDPAEAFESLREIVRVLGAGDD